MTNGCGAIFHAHWVHQIDFQTRHAERGCQMQYRPGSRFLSKRLPFGDTPKQLSTPTPNRPIWLAAAALPVRFKSSLIWLTSLFGTPIDAKLCSIASSFMPVLWITANMLVPITFGIRPPLFSFEISVRAGYKHRLPRSPQIGIFLGYPGLRTTGPSARRIPRDFNSPLSPTLKGTFSRCFFPSDFPRSKTPVDFR
jgi:hypothetical protein